MNIHKQSNFSSNLHPYSNKVYTKWRCYNSLDKIFNLDNLNDDSE